MAKTKDQPAPKTEDPPHAPTNGVGAGSPGTLATVPRAPQPSTLAVPVSEAASEFGKSLAKEDPRQAPRSLPIVKINHKHKQFVLPSGELVESVGGYPIFYASNRAFWPKAFATGAKDPPTCWSADGIKPAADSEHRESETCAACPKNQWKSGRDGKSKACSEITWTFLLNPAMFDPIGVLMSKPSSHGILHSSKFRSGVFEQMAMKQVATAKVGADGKPEVDGSGKAVMTTAPARYYEIVWVDFGLKPGGELHCVLDPRIGDVAEPARVRELAAIRKQYLDAFRKVVGQQPDAGVVQEHGEPDEPGGSDAANAWVHGRDRENVWPCDWSPSGVACAHANDVTAGRDRHFFGDDMQTKLFEIRDRGTCISAMAVRLESTSEVERWLLGRVGFGVQSVRSGEYVVLVNLSEMGATYDPFGWGGSRTMQVAHREIIKRFGELDTGAVIDVEFILGETSSPKPSELRPMVEV